jgi:predicted S18 family serine protease
VTDERNPLAETDAWIASCLEQYNVQKGYGQLTLLNDCLSRQQELGKILSIFHEDLKEIKRAVVAIRSAVGEIESRSQRTIAIAKEAEQSLTDVGEIKERVDRLAEWANVAKKQLKKNETITSSFNERRRVYT